MDGFEAWRDAARALLADQVPPDAVDWLDTSARADGQGTLTPPDQRTDNLPERAAPPNALRLPRSLLERLRRVGRHCDPARWALMYRVLWRVAHGEPDAASEADVDGARLSRMDGHVRHEIHRMHAFARFRELPLADGPAADGGAAGAAAEPPLFSWIEPEHDVLDEVAPHFARRLGARPFTIACPAGSAHWDGQELRYRPAGAVPLAPPPPADDPAWDAYYRSTFNPARANPRALARQMPVRYWRLLPEARLIPQMLADARAGAAADGAAPLRTLRRGATLPAPPAVCTADLDATQLQACRRCELWAHATQAVAGEGAPDARLMIVGEQPGDEEDLRGRPFVGPAGRLLDRAIAQAGLDRGALYLTNAVKHFKWEPRGKRRLHKTPGQKEIDACSVWLREELSTSPARVVVTMGATALAAVHRAAGLPVPKAPLARLAGRPLPLGDRWLMPTYHPSYVLRLPDDAQRETIFASIVDALRTADAAARECLEADEPTRSDAPAQPDRQIAPATANAAPTAQPATTSDR